MFKKEVNFFLLKFSTGHEIIINNKRVKLCISSQNKVKILITPKAFFNVSKTGNVMFVVTLF